LWNFGLYTVTSIPNYRFTGVTITFGSAHLHSACNNETTALPIFYNELNLAWKCSCMQRHLTCWRQSMINILENKIHLRSTNSYGTCYVALTL